jgi:hypothetical protein
MLTLTRVKNHLKWHNFLAVVTLVLLGVWLYSRVWMVNPAILGDEYLYSINSRKAAPWDPSPAGDFSNYLFNFFYQATNICGDAFYSCAKVLNLVFFSGFIFTLFIVALRFLPFWAAYAFMIAAGLSPLSVYTSMFLPESMYMFFMGLLLVAVLHAIKEFKWQNWAIVGTVIGIASLVKPHAWLSALAVGITLLVVGLGNRSISIRTTSLAVGALVAGSVISRLFVGLVVAGPKAIGFFGQYLGFSTVELVISGTGPTDNMAGSASSPMSGVLALFAVQANVHLLVISALMAVSVAAVTLGVIEVARSRTLSPSTGFALFSFIWLFSLMLEIVIFTGWVTGSGDDHTTRVLLRYYEFLFVIVPLAGLAVLRAGYGQRANVWIRWAISGFFAALLTPAFTGFFASLTIQIADAPTLAGLVVNSEVFNGVAIIGFLALLLLATFPKFASLAFIALLPFTMVSTGWQIQDQYQKFRGANSVADIAGQYLRDSFTDQEIGSTVVLASSRFDATNVAIWADNPGLRFELYGSGSIVDAESLPEDTKFVVVTEGISLVNAKSMVYAGTGFEVFKLAE